MKLSEMIRNLRVFMFEHGDIDCWYAVDDEGNNYQQVYYEPTLYYVDEDGDIYSQDEVDDEDMDDLTPVCVVN